MKMEKVSVIIPVYKVEKYLRKCLESIVNQTYPNIEVLIVDDGSPDGCGAIGDEYAAKYDFVQIFHKPNGGLGSARNYGLERATGDWILHVDGDDWCAADYIERMLTSGENTGIELILSSHMCQKSSEGEFEVCGSFAKEGVYRQKRVIQILQARCVGRNVEKRSKYNYLFIENPVLAFPWDKLYRREVIEKHRLRYNEKLQPQEDRLFNVVYFKYVTGARYVDTRGYYYRYSETALTKQIDKKFFDKAKYRVDMLCEYCEIFKDNPYMEIARIELGIWEVDGMWGYLLRKDNPMRIKEKRREYLDFLAHSSVAGIIKSTELKQVKGIFYKIKLLLAKCKIFYLYYCVRIICRKLKCIVRFHK